MDKKNKIIIISITMLLGFSIGRYSAPTKIETKTVTIEVEKKVEDTDKKEHTRTVEVIKPNGTRTTTIEQIIEESSKTIIDKTNLNENTKLVESKNNTTNISLLAGVDIYNPKLVYGLAMSKGILGPVTIGIFGFTNKLIGASIGLNF